MVTQPPLRETAMNSSSIAIRSPNVVLISVVQLADHVRQSDIPVLPKRDLEFVFSHAAGDRTGRHAEQRRNGHRRGNEVVVSGLGRISGHVVPAGW